MLENLNGAIGSMLFKAGTFVIKSLIDAPSSTDPRALGHLSCSLAVAHLERVGKVPPLSCKLVDAMVLLADFQIVSDVPV